MIWTWKLALFVLLVFAALAIGISLARVPPPEDKSTPPKADRTVVRTIQYVPQNVPPPEVTVASRFAAFIEPPVAKDEPVTEGNSAVGGGARRVRKRASVGESRISARPAHRRVASDSFCARYGMRKVVTHGGKSWRCRR
jgi:hypothetical protein